MRPQARRRPRPRPAGVRRNGGRRAPRASPRSGVLAAPVLLCQDRCRLGRPARGRRELRQRERGDGQPRATTRPRASRARPRSSPAPSPRRSPSRPPASSGSSFRATCWSAACGPRRSRSTRTARSASPARSSPQTSSTSTPRVEVELPSGTVTLSAQAKGAGMISPGFATMLCFVQTDAALAQETAELLLGVTVKRSFERISVDGQLSTNDTAILMASGASGVSVAPESDDELRFGEALDALLRQIALLMVARRRGRGARRARRRAGRPSRGRRGQRAGGRELSARQGRAQRRRPELGPDRAGGRDGDARHGSASARHRHRGRAGVPGGRGRRLRPRGAGARGRGARGRLRGRPARRGRRDRGLLLATSRTAT